MGRITLVAVAFGVGLAAAGGVAAQSRRSAPAPRSGLADQDSLPPSVPPPISTLAPVRGISGPRLEVGAVLCGSEADLQSRAQVTRRIADGEADPGNPLQGCRILPQQRGVEIVSRHGPGRTQVKVKPSGELGWTDGYFP